MNFLLFQVNEVLDDRARLKQQKNLIKELQMKIEQFTQESQQLENQRLLQEIEVSRIIKRRLMKCVTLIFWNYLRPRLDDSRKLSSQNSSLFDFRRKMRSKNSLA